MTYLGYSQPSSHQPENCLPCIALDFARIKALMFKPHFILGSVHCMRWSENNLALPALRSEQFLWESNVLCASGDRVVEEYTSLSSFGLMYMVIQGLLGKTAGFCSPYLWTRCQDFLVGLGNTPRSQEVVITSSASGNNVNYFSCHSVYHKMLSNVEGNLYPRSRKGAICHDTQDSRG